MQGLPMERWLTGASFGLAVAAAVFLLVWPVYSGFNDGHPTRATLLQVNGPGALIVLFPVFVTLMPLLARKHWARIGATILTGGFAIIGGFTIGLFYLPSALVMLFAAGAAGWNDQDPNS